MHISIVATDFDGTISEGDRLAPHAGRVLRRLREMGLVTILISGRPFDFLHDLQEREQAFDLIVAENGAVLYNSHTDEARLPFGQVPDELIDTLAQAGVPMWRGAAIAGTIMPYDDAVWVVSRELGLPVHVETNRNEVMILPPGVNKGAGLLNLLKSEGLSPRNLLAFGDAENDYSLLQAAEIKVAVANAVPALKELADYVTPRSSHVGVVAFLETYLLGDQPLDFPIRGAHHFGLDAAAEIQLNAHDLVDKNLLVAGDSGYGKSWLASRLADGLINAGYQLLALDPVGDLRTLRRHATCLWLGRDEVPPIGLVVQLLAETDLSLVIDLAQVHTSEERVFYTAGLLRRILELRQRQGKPHWLLVDEAQELLGGKGNPAGWTWLQASQAPGACLVTWQPSRLDPALLTKMDGFVLARCRLGSQVGCLARVLDERGLDVSELAGDLEKLGEGQALVWGLTAEPDERFTALKFSVGPRTFSQMQRLHRYLEHKVSAAQQFYFDDEFGYVPPAGNLIDLVNRMRVLDVRIIAFHFKRQDFTRWVREVLQDELLARWLDRLQALQLSGEALRLALLDTLERRHRVLERLF